MTRWNAGNRDVDAYRRLQINLADAETGSGGQIWQQCAQCLPPFALRAGDCVGGKQPPKVLPQTTSYGVFQ